MFWNKWIITNKEYVFDRPLYSYTLMWIDGAANQQIHVKSEKDLNISDFCDDNLNPLSLQYNVKNCDMATVKWVDIRNADINGLKRAFLFNTHFGCITQSTCDFGLKLKRDDEISIFVRNNPQSEYNTKHDPYFFALDMLENLTTGEKNPYITYDPETSKGMLERFVVVDVSNIGTPHSPARKSMMLDSPKFGSMFYDVSQNDPLFFTEENDKLCVERNPKTKTFDILCNISADMTRRIHVLRQKIH